MKQTFSYLLSFGLLFASTPSALLAQQREQQIKIGTAEVQLDIVIKDKKGRPVKDLKAGDFEVFEDGVKQPIESFRLVNRGSAAPTAKAVEATTENNPNSVGVEKKAEAAKPSGPSDVETKVSAIALVYDRLSPDARKRAHDAALSYVGEGEIQDHYAGVFTINLGLTTLQNYTNRTTLLRRAIDRAGMVASSTFESTGASVSGSTTQKITQAAAAGASASGGSGAGAAAGGAAAGAAGVDAMFAQMEERSKETFDVLQRDQQGFSTFNGLVAVVNSMKQLPGRKAIIFFSEGIALPPNVKRQFSSIINSANQANVSFYAIDTAGLRAESPDAASRDAINSRAFRRMQGMDRPDLSGPMTKNLERNEDILNLNPQNGLMQLAAETGGQFIGDTNNIAPKLKQIDEDLNTYYMVNYTPTNSNYDGNFRNISIKVNRSGIDVQSRKGYFAVGSTGSSPVLEYEAPALALLNSPTPPNAFPLQAISLNFPEAAKPGRTSISVQTAASSFTFLEGTDDKDKEKKVFSTNFSIVVLIKDQARQVVSKLSQNYVLAGSMDKINAVKNQNVLFYREADLPPGKFDVEVIAYDTPTKKASLRKTTIEVPEADETLLRLSSVSLINRIEQTKEKLDSPFQLEGIMVYPNLGDPIKKSAQKLGFFFTVYPVKGKADATKLNLELTGSGKSLANFPLKLTAPDATGRIQFASALPLDSLNPGVYELKITVKDGATTATRSTSFSLQP